MAWSFEQLVRHPKYSKLVGVNKNNVVGASQKSEKVDKIGSTESPAPAAPPAPADVRSPVRFVVPGDPVGKPRMTQADRWKKRAPVLQYRDYCDRIRAASPAWLGSVDSYGLSIVAYIVVPPSWSAKKQQQHLGKPHRSKPDGDNILKSVADALFDDDSKLWWHKARKFWCAAGESRTVVTVHFGNT